jgi:hypothetical protein
MATSTIVERLKSFGSAMVRGLAENSYGAGGYFDWYPSECVAGAGAAASATDSEFSRAAVERPSTVEPGPTRERPGQLVGV